MAAEPTEFGRHLRDVRTWRRLTLREAAQLSGISHGYLGKLERGEKAVAGRRVLEALARTLRVSPADLVGIPYLRADPVVGEVYAAIPAVEDAVTGWWLDEIPDAPRRPWHEVSADVRRLDRELRPRAAYVEQVELLPALIRDLLAATAGQATRRPALSGLLGAYKSVAYVALDLGFRSLPVLAVERMRRVAEKLGEPEVIADVAWRRAQILGGGDRARQYELATGVADDPEVPPHLRGMADLTAAMAAAAQGREDTAQARLAEAAELADVLDTDDRPWTATDFTRANVGIWRVSVGLELGYGAKVAEITRTAARPPEALPVPHRQATFWTDLGRGLLTERRTRERGLAALLRAETLAPQKVRANVFVRETVAGLLRTARQDSYGRELRGLAWRMGLAPTG